MQLEFNFTYKKQDVRIIRITDSDARFNSYYYDIFKTQVLKSEDKYPGINMWFAEKVFPGILSSRRIAYLGLSNGKPIAAAIAKKGERAKFCHLKIDEAFQSIGIGDLLFMKMAIAVQKNATELHFSMPESLWDTKRDFFSSYGFTDIVGQDYRYRSDEKELYYSKSFSELLSNMKDKINYFSNKLSFNRPHNGRLLISIKPKFALDILEGRKAVEIRRKFNEKWIGQRISIYASKPIQSVVGEAKIIHILAESPELIWNYYGEEIGCSKQEFLNYTNGTEKVYAIVLDDVVNYKNWVALDLLDYLLDSKLVPPMSYFDLYNNSKWSRAIEMAELLQSNNDVSNIQEMKHQESKAVGI
jgi:predicted transcriptional regulator